MRNWVPESVYHTSLKPPLTGIEPCTRWKESESFAAFVWDIMAGPLPPRYSKCDVLYADLPWQDGFDEFNRRAGVNGGRTYRGFMAAVSAVVEAQRYRPVYLVTGRHALKYLPDPDQTFSLRLDETPSLAIAYNVKHVGRSFGVADELLRYLARQHERVGDFCCGYGRSGRIFRRAGRAFTLSDVNAECIGYIAAHAAEWQPL